MTYVELSDRPDFNDKFVDQLAFPADRTRRRPCVRPTSRWSRAARSPSRAPRSSRRRGWPVDVSPAAAAAAQPPGADRRRGRARWRGELAAAYARVVVGYADCGTYGALDEVCERLRPAPAGRAALLRRVRRRRPARERSSTSSPAPTCSPTSWSARSSGRWSPSSAWTATRAARRLLRHYTRVVWLAQAARRRAARARRARPRRASGLPLTVVDTGHARARARARRARPAEPRPAAAATAAGRRVSRSRSAAPRLGLGDLVEREDVQAGDAARPAAASTGAHFSRNRSPVKPPGAASRANVPLCLARNRVDSPTPILVAIDSSLVRSIGPGHAEQHRHGDAAPPHPVAARSRSAAGSKLRLLTTYVACRRLSHIDCTVRSSLIVGCDSG